MALRNQPYIPLYVQDLMTDEKLNNCCAATHGIFIKGIMCLMHKSENYGKILLHQKFKQTDKQSKNFAIMLVRHLPYTIEEIESAIDELIEENVCYYEGDFICQKRMIKDGMISDIRAKAGKNGGEKTKSNKDKVIEVLVQQKVKQNMQQNTEDENEDENEDKNEIVIENDNYISDDKISKKTSSKQKSIITESEQQMFDQARKFYLGSKRGLQTELNNFVKKYPTEWRNILPLLLPAILREKVDKEQKLKNNGFNQQWKNFSTWINGRCWEIEYPNVSEKEVNELGISVTKNESGEQKVEVKQDRSSFPLYSSMQVMPHVYPEGTESRCGYYVIKNKECVRTKKY